MSSTFLTSPLMMQRSHSHSGQSIWRTAMGARLHWMHIGMRPWKEDPHPNLFAFRTEPDLRLARSSAVELRSAR